MSNHIQRILLSVILGIILATQPLKAFEFEVNGVNYKSNYPDETTVSVTGCDREISGELVIPDCVDYNGVSYNVTAISRYAFGSNHKFTSVIIGDNVISIGESAFKNSDVTYIRIGKSLEDVGGDAFAFWNKVHVDFHCKKIGDSWFDWRKHNSTAKKITMGDEVEEIGDDAFNNCKGLDDLEIGKNVRRIGKYAFYFTNIKNLVVPDNVRVIDDCAFADVPLETLVLGNSLDSIGAEAFEGGGDRNHHNFIETLTIPSSVTYIGELAFRGCERLKTIIIKEGQPLTIGERAFTYCQELSSVYIPNSAIEIREEAFRYCTKLTSVSIGDNIKTIGMYAFAGCPNIVNLTLGKGLEEIGSGAFMECNKMKTVKFHEGLKKIGGSAFMECESFESIELPNSVTEIGGMAF